MSVRRSDKPGRREECWMSEFGENSNGSHGDVRV